MENINKLSLDEKKYNGDSLKAITNEELAVILHKHKCWVESEGKEGEQAELTRFNLGNRNLSNVNLENAKLNGTNFYKANLQCANLKNAALKGAFLNEANLQHTNLSGAVLKFAELKKSSCMWTNFEKADLFRTNFCLAEIEGASFVDVKTGDKSLEQILKVAKINSIYTNNLPNQNNMVQIVEDEDADTDEPFNVLEKFSSHKEENFNDEDVQPTDKSQNLNAEEELPINTKPKDIEPTDKSQNLNAEEELPINTKPAVDWVNLKPTNRLNLRVIVVGLTLASLITGMFLSNMWQSKATAKELNNNELGATNLKTGNVVASNEVTPTQDSSDEEIPYLLEFNPNDIKEDPTVILGVGNVTRLDIDLGEQPKEIIVGDKEVVEITKSPSNPKRLYLIGKTATDGSNLVIETISGKTLTIFFKIVEHAGLGDFNGEVHISSKKEEGV